jgi:hypothetical protein
VLARSRLVHHTLRRSAVDTAAVPCPADIVDYYPGTRGSAYEGVRTSTTDPATCAGDDTRPSNEPAITLRIL